MKLRIHAVEPTEQEIQHVAYLLWEEAGKPEGRDLEIWLSAKERLKHRTPVNRGQRGRGPAVETLSAHTVEAIAVD